METNNEQHGVVSSGPGIDQETAMDELRERYAHGGLPIDEFRRLIGALMVTTDPKECQAILDELPPDPTFRRSLTVASSRSVSAVRRTSAGRSITAFFGEVDRSRALWELGPETDVTAMFGEVRLDVRMARMAEGESVLRLHALFGEISVIVPEGMEVIIEGSARFGEVSVPGHHVAGILTGDSFELGPTNAPAERHANRTLRIEATATFGEVKIRAR
ncbi:MAG: cell wall-active antibiotics response protein [Ktedonobacterales bacterium]